MISLVTGSSKRSECMEGTKINGVAFPLAAESAIITGESIIPFRCLEIVFLVAGATMIPS